MKKKLALVLTLAIVLTACSQKIDGSSEAAFNQSIEQLTKDMTPEQRQEFGKNMGLAAATAVGATGGDRTVSLILDPKGFSKRLREALDGKSASDIEKLAKQELERRKLAEIESLDKQIADAETYLAKVITVRESLNNIVLEDVQLSHDSELSSGLYGTDEIVKFKVGAELVNKSTIEIQRRVEIQIEHQGVKTTVEAYLDPDTLPPNGRQRITFASALIFGRSASERGQRFDEQQPTVLTVAAIVGKGVEKLTASQADHRASEARKRIQALRDSRSALVQGGSMAPPEPTRTVEAPAANPLSPAATAPSPPSDATASPLLSQQSVDGDRVDTIAGAIRVVPAEESNDGQKHLELNGKKIQDLSDDHISLLKLFRYKGRDVLLMTHACGGSACSFTSVALLDLHAGAPVKVHRHQQLTINTDGAEPDVLAGADGSLTLSFDGQTGPQRWRHFNGELTKL